MAKQNGTISRQKERMRRKAYFPYDRPTCLRRGFGRQAKLSFWPKFYCFGSHRFSYFYRFILRWVLIIPFAFAVPTFAFAAAPTNFKEFAEFAVKVLQNVIGILFASLAIGLLYGVILYLFSSPSEKRRSEIKEMLLWGVIGIIVVMGIWGILGILRESLFGVSAVGIPFIRPPS